MLGEHQRKLFCFGIVLLIDGLTDGVQGFPCCVHQSASMRHDVEDWLTFKSQIIGVRVLLWILSLFINMDHAQWDDDVSNGLHFLEHSVLQVPFFMMTLMRYVTPTLDQM